MTSQEQQVAKFVWVGTLLPDLMRTPTTVRQTALKFPMRKFEPYTLTLDEGEYAYHPYPSDITIPIIGGDELVFREFNHTDTIMTMKYVNPTTQKECSFNLADFSKNTDTPVFEFDAIVIDLNDTGEHYKGDFYFFNRETDDVVAHMKFIPHGSKRIQKESLWMMTNNGGVAMFDA